MLTAIDQKRNDDLFRFASLRFALFRFVSFRFVSFCFVLSCYVVLCYFIPVCLLCFSCSRTSQTLRKELLILLFTPTIYIYIYFICIVPIVFVLFPHITKHAVFVSSHKNLVYIYEHIMFVDTFVYST
jgi:hypothetical protein